MESTPKVVQNNNNKVEGNNDMEMEDDGEGKWETVKPRQRSKNSPLNRDRLERRSFNEKKSNNGSNNKAHHHKTRYHAPSSAISLPSLALMKEEALQEEGDNKSSDENIKVTFETPLKLQSKQLAYIVTLLEG